MSKFNRSLRSRKAVSGRTHFVPAKPYDGFPLTPVCNGAWTKKIKGKVYYFGSWGRVVNGKLTQIEGDGWWRPALEKYEAEREARFLGQTPRVKSDELTVRELCNRFLTAKKRKLESGEITQRSFDEYVTLEADGTLKKDANGNVDGSGTVNLIVAQFGKDRLVDDLASNDFETLRADLATRFGPVRLGNEIGRVKSVFSFGYAAGLMKVDPKTRFGGEFKKPSASVMRRHRAQNGTRMLEAAEIRALINAAPVPLKAMILLGANCGFGNADCATLPLSALDLDGGWVDYARPKTGIERKAALWPKTVEALRAAIAERPEPKEGAEPFLFLMKGGYSSTEGRQWLTNGVAFPIVKEIGKLMKSVGVHRKGLGFYTLRHVFRTAADGALDPVAVNLIMGHADHTMGANYTHGIYDSRLRAVAQHVHDWLYPNPVDAPTDEPTMPERQRTPKVKPVTSEGAEPSVRLRIVG